MCLLFAIFYKRDRKVLIFKCPQGLFGHTYRLLFMLTCLVTKIKPQEHTGLCHLRTGVKMYEIASKLKVLNEVTWG